MGRNGSVSTGLSRGGGGGGSDGDGDDGGGVMVVVVCLLHRAKMKPYGSSAACGLQPPCWPVGGLWM